MVAFQASVVEQLARIDQLDNHEGEILNEDQRLEYQLVVVNV